MFRKSISAVLAVCVLGLLGLFCTSALATGQGSGWMLTGRTFPTHIAPQGTGTIVVDVLNDGAVASGLGATFTDVLPRGVTALQAGELNDLEQGVSPVIENNLWACSGNGSGAAPDGAPGIVGATVITCTNKTPIAGGGGFLTRQLEGQPEVGIEVTAADEVSGSNDVAIAGGGAAVSASTSDPVVFSEKPVGFEVTGWDGWFSNADGTIDTQAGSHPYEATFSIDMASFPNPNSDELAPAGGEFRTVETFLPPGFVGDPTAAGQCSRQQLLEKGCPADSQIGVVVVTTPDANKPFQLFNMVPPAGVPAEFGFNFEGLTTFAQSTVRSGGDYGLNTDFVDIPQKVVLSSLVTVWGTPNEQSHDQWRTESLGGCGGGCSLGSPRDLKPFLTLPTSCGEPQPFTARVNSWEHPSLWVKSTFLSHDSHGNPTGFTGCATEGFGPTITTSPDTSDADTPAGLTVDLKPPLGGLEDPEGLSTSDIQDTTVTLPEGLVINPGQAAGLQACPAGRPSFEPGNERYGDALTTPEEKANEAEDDGPPNCPNASKVGTVTAKTPLLEGAEEKELHGNVYVLQSNPPHLQLLVAPEADGVYIKQVLNVNLNETTGQITSTAAGFPQAPVSDVKLSFSGGAQAALATPTGCATYTTSSDFTPWGSPFIADVNPTATFGITAGTGGAPCPGGVLPFQPNLIAGATTDQAGAFTNFSLLLQTADDQQRIDQLQFKVPQGLSGMLSKVPLCPEPQANLGTCGAASQIGHTTVASGPGPYPLVIPQPGQPPAAIYLTGPYNGAPFGLSIVVPIVVGPFVLKTQIVRAKIEVDPHTAAITVTTNPLPQVVDGVPTDLRTVNAVIDRNEFMFNPTNCNEQAFSGTATSAQGTPAAISSRFQTLSCQVLKFAPKFTVTTSGKTSKANGASLTAKVSYPNAPQGTQSNITRVKVDLPKQLPSRLTTLQKACTNAQFEANPAGCPAASKIGYAIVHTPLLPVPVSGPAIFVSHGGEAFPSLTMVLQGDNVTVDLVGTTFISKKGITSTTFKTVPDVPFSTFELTLPQGKYSALAANGNLCKSKLAMPTEFLAQNGLKLNESTKVRATGCPHVKKSKHRKKGHRAKQRKKA